MKYVALINDEEESQKSISNTNLNVANSVCTVVDHRGHSWASQVTDSGSYRRVVICVPLCETLGESYDYEYGF